MERFELPDVGEGLTEAEIVRWRVRPGDTVALNQVIVEIETAKALVELPCPYEGTVADLLVAEGETVPVGTPIIAVASSGEPPPSLVGYGAPPEETAPGPRAARDTRARPPVTAPPGNGEPARAKPLVRRLARDLGVDLERIAGTGPQHTVTRADVLAAARTGDDTAPIGPPPAARDERVPVRGVRRRTAAAMTRSAFTAPHVTTWLQTDVTDLVEVVDRLRAAGLRLTPLPLVARALLIAVGRHPMINSSWDEPAGEIVIHHRVDLGIAVATDRGLLVPTVRDARALTLRALADALEARITAAREGRSTPADLADGTITITNVGVFGVDGGTPILPPGQAAILAVGQIRELPWVHDGVIAIRKVVTLALSFDHRIIDGDAGSTFLRDVAALLADPRLMLAGS